MTRVNKKAVYAAHGIEYRKGKLYSPRFGWINPLLINGNSKLGRGVWTWSTLAGTRDYNITFTDGTEEIVRGTCPVNCPGCYAQSGCYCFSSTRRALAVRTILARDFLNWVERAIRAQLAADRVKMVRIHAAGDFFSNAYADMWKRIAADFSGVRFWTYTKKPEYETLFDGLENANIVKSLLPCGVNYGKADYLLKAYEIAKQAGTVHICRCGIDPDQHCTNCAGCSKHDFVLFVEHGTGYKPEEDAAFPALKAIIENQPTD